MFLARMINRSKWQARDGLAPDEIPADAITADLRTAANALSFWQCAKAGSEDISNVVLAIAAGRDRVQKLDIAWIHKDRFEQARQEIRPSPGRTPVAGMIDRHVDVCRLDYHRLGKIGEAVALAIRQERWRRYRQRQVLNLLVTAVQDGRLLEKDLAAHIRAQVRAKLTA